jgi:glycosyltransferase involved in cell wall biosynthesis
MDALFILDTVSVALPAVLAGWVLRTKTIIRTGGDFVWERYIERTQERVLLSEFYESQLPLSRKERMLVWLQKRIIFPLVDHLIISTSWQRDIWLKPYNLDVERTSIIEHVYVPQEEFGPGGDSFLCAWRPTRFKNVDMLEEAYKLLEHEYQTRHQGKNVPELMMLKNVPREEFFQTLKHARALVVPSLSETGPIIALESLAMGIPVILTEDCGMRYRYQDAVMYVDPKDPESIKDAMLRMTDEQTYQTYRQKARQFSYTFTYDDVALAFIEAYKKLI